MERKEKDRPAARLEPQVPDYNLKSIGELLPGALESGRRVVEAEGGGRKKLCPCNSERMNRALGELGLSAFKIHTRLWKWRGAPAKGVLPFFTIHSLARCCAMSRPTVRGGLEELVSKGWIRPGSYNKHNKNRLYRLVAVRDIPAAAIEPPRRR